MLTGRELDKIAKSIIEDCGYKIDKYKEVIEICIKTLHDIMYACKDKKMVLKTGNNFLEYYENIRKELNDNVKSKKLTESYIVGMACILAQSMVDGCYGYSEKESGSGGIGSN